MPRGYFHKLFNATLGLVAGLIIYHDWFDMALFTFFCIATASLPDRIEKPYNKYHRGAFHSWIACISSLALFFYFITNPLSGLLYGYSCHILLDKSRSKSFVFNSKASNEEHVKPGEENESA